MALIDRVIRLDEVLIPEVVPLMIKSRSMFTFECLMVDRGSLESISEAVERVRRLEWTSCHATARLHRPLQ